MNFDEYEKRYEVLYAEFARIVRDILDKAITGTQGAPRPQSIQCRAKEASHLKPNLEARGLLASSSIEEEIKDLAGTRLIFFTNTDVEQFLSFEPCQRECQRTRKYRDDYAVKAMSQKRANSRQTRTQLWKRLDARNPAKGYGTVAVGKVWSWYETWLTRVREECQQYSERYRTAPLAQPVVPATGSVSAPAAVRL